MTIFIEPSTGNRPVTRSQKAKDKDSFLETVAETNPKALTDEGRAEVETIKARKNAKKVKPKKSPPKKWTWEEDEKLMDEILGSLLPTENIAQEHKRSPTAIRQRVIHLLAELRYRHQMMLKTKFVWRIVTHSLVAVTAYALGNHPDAIPLPQVNLIGVSA